jgi:secondary thiamine-phosphate synthase enzyme
MGSTDSMEILEMLTPVPTYHHALIRLRSDHPTQFIDLTGRLQQIVERARIHCGIVNVQTLHTTTAVVVNELEPLLLDDFATLLDDAAPRHVPYRHDDVRQRTVNVTADERVNGHAHCRALLLGSSVSLNIVDGALRLGQWQRVLMAELDGPRTREISVVVMGERRR